MSLLPTTLTSENQYIKIDIIDNIIYGVYKVKQITLEVALSAVQLRKELTNGQSLPALIKDYETVKIDKKAREFLASNEGIEGISAAAVLTNSIYKSSLMNFFIKVLPPKIPVKTFKNEKNALLWLNTYK